MKFKIPHIAFLFAPVFLFGQTADTTIPTDIEIRTLLLTLRPIIGISGIIILADSPCTLPRDSYEKLFLNKRNSTFSNQDIAFILRQYDFRQKTKWTKSIMDSARVIAHDSINVIFRHGPEKGWKQFRRKYGFNFYEISFPLLNLEKNYCLIRTRYHCGDLCGEYLTLILKLDNGKWKLYKTLARGYS